MIKKWTLCLMACVSISLFAGCGDSATIAIIGGAEITDVETQQSSPAVFNSEVSSDFVRALNEIVQKNDEENCNTDIGLACPLVKPVELMTKQYKRTPQQEERLANFDALSLEEKAVALQDGSVVCTEFAHDYKWEHLIDENWIALVGRDLYEKWLEIDDSCQSIYSFAVAFDWDYSEIEIHIRENGLQDIYDLNVIQKKLINF